MVEIDEKVDGCCNCVHNWFGDCDKYGYHTEEDLMGVSICDYDGWEKE